MSADDEAEKLPPIPPEPGQGAIVGGDGMTMKGDLLSRLLAAEIDPQHPPPPDEPIFYVAGKLTGTAGNIGAITGRAKSYKSAVIEAHCAACMVAEGLGVTGADTLGITAEPPRGKAVVIIDTEQSPADACYRVNRSLRRVGLKPEERPPWLRAFAFAGWKAQDLTAGLPQLLERLATDHSGIHAVLIDGGADFAINVNDPEAAADLCAGWHALAIRFRCHILIVIHSNEGAKSDDTARGWLGKQLRRKAESNLQLQRDGEAVTLFAEHGQRRAPIPEAIGPRFQWSEAHGMPMSIGTAGEARATAKTTKLRELAEEVFEAGAQLSYTEMKDAIAKARGYTPRWAEKQIEALKSAGVIRSAGGGRYAFI